MTFRRSTATALGAAALLAVTAITAHAGPPWTVSVGGSSTGAPASFIATSGVIETTMPGQNLGCDSGTAEGTISPGVTSSKAGEIWNTEFIDCHWVLGAKLEVTQLSTWDVNITGDNSEGVTPIHITNIAMAWSEPQGLCAFEVYGAAAGSFDENAQRLTVDNSSAPESLLIENVYGCFGLHLEGDEFTLEATYDLANIAPVTITN